MQHGGQGGLKKYFPSAIKGFSRNTYISNSVGKTAHMMEVAAKDKPGKGHLPQQITPSPGLKHFKVCSDRSFYPMFLPWKDGDEH